MSVIRMITVLACLAPFGAGEFLGHGAVSHPPAQPLTIVSATPSTATPTNRLAREKSPYLLQHQHNPVDWFAWGPEAFATAAAQDKPIFLSIGYSTCHWCHVMERESFESATVATFLNEHFVSIKVDREERPDVDHIYMNFVQATVGQGGWPLTVFLAPDLKPFFGGTYFPPESRYGRPSFLQLLEQIHQIWQTQRGEVLHAAGGLHERLAAATERPAALQAPPATEVLQQAASLFKHEYDRRHGGFGGEPKFPRPAQPAFLLAHAARTSDAEAKGMVLHTCDRMAAGGIYDHLGGGFARYSVDAQWRVPHFEKMLYDNAQLVELYLDAFLVSGEPCYGEVARDILRYVLRDMTHPDGGFYSAEDADSEGKEGKFYCWTRAELASLLTPAEFSAVIRRFGVTEQGNFVDHSDPSPLQKQNVLYLADAKPRPGEEAVLRAAKEKMFAARAKRVRPHLDDKVLASWNGQMLGAAARAGVVLGDATFLAAARKNLGFLQARLWDPATKTLYHRWRDGQRDQVQLLEAYAFLLAGVLELYEADLDAAQLEFAVALAEPMLTRFHDAEKGGFWQSAAGASDLILRLKEDYDGAQPAGNSVAVLALLKLAAITERREFQAAAGRTLDAFSSVLQQSPQAAPYLLRALQFSAEPPKRIVIAGDPTAPETRELLRAAHSVYLPGKVVLGTAGAVEPFARGLPVKDRHPTAYVCTGVTCQPPTSDARQLKQLLAR